jgi:hypothetical protein
MVYGAPDIDSRFALLSIDHERILPGSRQFYAFPLSGVEFHGELKNV